MSHTYEQPSQDDFSLLVRQISIDKLQEESKKLSGFKPGAANQVARNPKEALCTMFLNSLMRPKEWNIYQRSQKFPFKRDHILELAHECQSIVQAQPLVLQLRAPVKVLGNVFGGYVDLMRFFDLWKFPGDTHQGGDIDGFDYLFLGNYVDRGLFSLEVVCLLMALKVKFPEQVHLLRGNHEDRHINATHGFGEECRSRLGEDIGDPASVFAKVNEMFEWLPVAATIDSKIFCVHGGIGSSAAQIAGIKNIKRPIELSQDVSTQEQQIVVDLLWSDPTDNGEPGIQAHQERDPNGAGSIVKFGPDRVEKFLKTNNLSLIIRSH